jgi:hypothetical protein
LCIVDVFVGNAHRGSQRDRFGVALNGQILLTSSIKSPGVRIGGKFVQEGSRIHASANDLPPSERSKS